MSEEDIEMELEDTMGIRCMLGEVMDYVMSGYKLPQDVIEQMRLILKEAGA